MIVIAGQVRIPDGGGRRHRRTHDNKTTSPLVWFTKQFIWKDNTANPASLHERLC